MRTRLRGIKYLPLNQRQADQVFFRDGLLTTPEGLPLNRDGMYVMNLDGSFVVRKVAAHDFLHLHHPSLSGGDSVYCAGEIKIENGIITHIDNRSGHYRPTGDQFRQFVAWLWDNGAKMTPTAVTCLPSRR
jgi:hypothetical protein